MDVLWLSHVLPHPPVGRGVLQRSFHLLSAACRRHDVHLVSFAHHALDGDEAEAVEQLSRMCERVEAVEPRYTRESAGWWALVLSSYFSSLPYEVNWLSSTKFRETIEAARERTSFDLVHADTLGLAPYSRLVDAPLALNHHDIESHLTARRAENEDSMLKELYLRKEAEKTLRYERRWCRQAAVNLVVSDLDSERLREATGDVNVRVVENGVDVEYFGPHEPIGKGEGSLVFAGGMNSYANREAVLYFLHEIWPLLRDEGPRRELVIVGSDPPEELLAASRRDDRVHAPGFVDDVRPYIDRASIYVCPIRQGGGTRLKILDALAMAKPLVATEMSVEGLGLREKEHYLQADDPEDWVRQIERLEEDIELRRQLARNGRRLVEERYSWETIGEDLEAAYREAVRSGSEAERGESGSR